MPMKTQKFFIFAGSSLVFFGLIFHLQGQSIIGPQSSFMYSNPDWITYGIQIIILGFIIILMSFTINIISKKINS